VIQLRADRSLLRADARNRRYLLVELCAPEAPARKSRLPVNLAFVIDRSGSMHGQKIANARKAVLHGIRTLSEGDRFSVVAYDDQVDRVVASVAATAEARQAAAAAVERIETRASTNLHGGWSEGCEQVVAHLASEAVNRCLLLTDGLANAGETDHDEIVRQCAGWRDRRVTTTTFGLGADFDETLLRRMADAGGGNFQFIESAAQIADFVASEVGEALATTVREGVLVIDAGPGAEVESLNDFACRQEGGAWRVSFGSLYSGQPLTQVLRVALPEGTAGESREVAVRVEDQDGALAQARAAIRFTWASEDEVARQAAERAVLKQAALLQAARAERDALERNRHGDYAGARQVIEACLKTIAEYAADDPEIQAIVTSLQRKVQRYGRAMDPLASKTLHSLSSMTLRSRPLRIHTSPSQPAERSLVPSEWDAQAAVAKALARVAADQPDLLKDVDLRLLSESLAHLEKRGCLLDPALNSAGEIELRLQAPGLCSSCRKQLDDAGIPRDRLDRLIEALRLLGAPSGVVH